MIKIGIVIVIAGALLAIITLIVICPFATSGKAETIAYTILGIGIVLLVIGVCITGIGGIVALLR